MTRRYPGKTRLPLLFGIIAALAVLSIQASAAPLRRMELKFTEFTVENGLSYNSVIDICQDTTGTMWFATTDGLNKFNGHDITIYRHKHDDPTSIPSNSLHKIKMDTAHILWVCTSNGLAYYDAIADVFRKADIPEAISIEDMVQIDSTRFLIATRNASFIYDKADGSSYEFRIDDAPLVFYSACRDGDNIIICTRWRFIETMHVKDGKLCRKYEPMKIPRFGVIPLPAGDETYYIGTKGAGLLKADVKHGTFKKIDIGHDGWFQIFALAFDTDGKTWVGTQDGLMILDNDNCIYTSDFKELKDKNIRSLFRDSSGGLWIGTEFAGVKYWNRKRDKFRPYIIPGRIPAIEDEIMTVIYCEPSGAIWTGTRYNGLDRYDPASGRHDHYDVNNVRTICMSEDGRYAYTGAEVNGMHSIDVRTGEVRLLTTPIDIMSIKQASHGKLWLGALVGLYIYDPEQDTATRLIPESGNRLIRFLNLFKDSKGRLWAGAKENLMVFKTDDDNTVHDITPHVLDEIVQIQCFCETADRTMWIGTLDGLIAYQEEKNGESSIEYINGMQSSTIRGIEEDEDGNLWISTDSGLCRYDRNTGKIRKYNHDDGLRCNLFNACTHSKDTSGALYFGGILGVEILNPKDITINTETWSPSITELIVNNSNIKPYDRSGILKEDIRFTRRITLRHWQNSVTLRFSCADMVSGDSNTFKYMLEGFDKDWNLARGHEATYTNLDKGSYVFLLKAANSDGIWCETPRRLEIIVKPVWYRSTLASFILIVLLAGMVAAFMLWLLKKKELDKDNEIKQLTKEYEEKVQKTKLEMFVDSSYDLKPNEETFLSSVLACIEQNIPNQNFTVETIAEHVCLSRGNLHLKVKALTGKTPVELIKVMRMKKACALMKETTMSVAEIAEQTGFQTPGYFITVFKSTFGETPGKYAARVRKK